MVHDDLKPRFKISSVRLTYGGGIFAVMCEADRDIPHVVGVTTSSAAFLQSAKGPHEMVLVFLDDGAGLFSLALYMPEEVAMFHKIIPSSVPLKIHWSREVVVQVADDAFRMLPESKFKSVV